MTPILTANDSTPEFARIAPEDSATNGEHWSSPIPLSMPQEQIYYWSLAWQAEEAGALADLVSGRFTDFNGDDPGDVARWLQAPDDESDA